MGCTRRAAVFSCKMSRQIEAELAVQSGRRAFNTGPFMFQRAFLPLALAATVLAGTTLPADALDRRVRIVNETGVTMVRFFGSNTGSGSWEEDILGEDVLPSGSAVVVNFDDASGYCKFDFKAVFEDGDELVRQGVNVCETGTFTYN